MKTKHKTVFNSTLISHTRHIHRQFPLPQLGTHTSSIYSNLLCSFYRYLNHFPIQTITTKTKSLLMTESQSSFMKFCRKLSPKRKHSGKQHNNNGEEKNKDLEAVFAYMDSNRDGRISPVELQKSFETLGEQLSDEEAEAAVRLSDTDGDGMLDFDEFSQLIKGDDEEEKKMELKEAFRMYIAEGEDCITPTSLKMMLKKLGESTSIDDCRVMITAFDLNADGVLSFDEFALMMR